MAEKNHSGLRGLRFPGLKHDGYFPYEPTPFKTDPKARERLIEFARSHGIKT